MDKVAITLGDETVGTLTAEDAGLYRQFYAECRRVGTEVFRLYAVGEWETLALGIPVPDGTRLTLRKRIPRKSADLGLLLRGELRPCRMEVPPQEVWQSVSAPEELFRSGFLKEQVRGISGVLTRQDHGIRKVAIPYNRHRPFLLVSLFCFARILQIEGEQYAVFGFDWDENPVFW